MASAGWGQAKTTPFAGSIAKDTVRKADVEAAVALLCPAKDIVREKDGSASGCKTCPVGTDFHNYGQSSLDIYRVMFGHFTSASDDGLLLSGSGCDSHGNNFGGSFVFSFKEGKPRLLKYANGLLTDQCYKFAFPDGREFLVCKGGWSGQGEGDAYVFMASFGANGKDASTTILSTRDTTGLCSGESDDVFQSSDIQDIRFAKNESGGITGMTITATLGNVTCTQNALAMKTKKLPASVKTHKIEFLFDGKQFKVAPASRASFNFFANN